MKISQSYTEIHTGLFRSEIKTGGIFMQVSMRGHIFFTVISVVLLFLSIVCRLTTGVMLRRLAAEAENMSATRSRFLKQCKLKFQSYYELGQGVMNVGVFVDKFLQGLRVGKLNLRLWAAAFAFGIFLWDRDLSGNCTWGDNTADPAILFVGFFGLIPAFFRFWPD